MMFGLGQSSTDTTAADLAALQASAAQGGFETSQGSYSVNPSTGQVTFTPTTSVATSLIPGISNTALSVVGIGAAIFLFALSSGGRR